VDTISLDQVRPGDVLLYAGTSVISRAIQVFDGTWASHAAIYLGNGEVGEAVADGLVQQGVERSYEGSDWVEVRRLKTLVPSMNPVIWIAEEYLSEGNRYGYEQLLLLAFLCLTRKLPMSPSLRLLMRAVLDSGAALLTRMLSQKREPMICSEFAYRVYDQALPEAEDAYSIRLGQPVPYIDLNGPGAELYALESYDRPSVAQGIHPASWLGLLATPASNEWILSSGEADIQEEAEYAVAVETLVESYLAEVQSVDLSDFSEAAVADVSLGELRAATDRFAAAFYEASYLQESPEYEEAASLSTRSAAYGHLFVTAADFVTPGDLLNSPSLYPVGRLSL